MEADEPPAKGEGMKEVIKDAMKRIARRKPGNSKLVYDRARQTIIVVDREGKYIRDAGITVHDI